MKCKRIVTQTTVIGSFSVLLFSAAPSAGAEARFKKKEIEVGGAAQTEITKPRLPTPQPAQPVGPVLTVDAFLDQQREKVHQLTDKQIRYMADLATNAASDDPQRPDYLFRLGELLADRQRLLTFNARALDQPMFAAEQAKDQAKAAKLKQQQQHYERLAEDSALKAIKSYIAASKHPTYARMDEVLFRLAYLLQTIKKDDQAREFFHRLVKDYPQSKYIPNAYLAFGEHFFQRGEMENAGKFYDKVTQLPASSVFGYALYKRGWVAINLGNFKDALATFVKVIELCASGKLPKSQAGPLAREAKRDVVKAYARTPGASPDKAWDFFQRVGGDAAPKMLDALAELYWEQGMASESSRVYRKLMAQGERSPRLCEWQDKILRNTLSAGTKRDQVQEVKRAGNAYAIMAKRPDVKPDVLKECRNVYHDTTKELALIWHKEAQRTNNADTYQLAALLYQELLGHFGDEREAPEMTFFYGEVLWQMQSWKDAAEAYTKAVELAPKGKYAKEAAYAAVLAWKNALNIDDQGEGVDRDRESGLMARPIPTYQQKMIAAFDTYIRYVPDAPELVTIKYRKARIFYDYNHFADAAKLFGEIVDQHTSHALAVYSANLLLDCLNVLGRHRELQRTVDKYLANATLMGDAGFRDQMVLLKSDSLAAEARLHEQGRNYRECGVTFVAAAETLPSHKDHAERLYNAGLCFQKAHLIGQAIRVREALLAAHPKDALAQRALFQVASGYHQLAYYGEAAKRYEEFANAYPAETRAVTALGNAYAFRMGLGELDQAIADMTSFVRHYGDKRPAETANVVFQMSEVYEKEKKTDELVRNLEDYLTKWGAKGGIDKQILAHFKLGELAWTRSCAQGAENGACIKVERAVMNGAGRIFDWINSGIKDRRRRLRERSFVWCGPTTSAKITVYDRAPALAAQAQKHFAEVLRLWARGEAARRLRGQLGPTDDVAAREGTMRFAVAGAAFYQAEQVYERFLAVRFPQGLDFQQATASDSKRVAAAKQRKYEDSQKRFLAYLTEKGRLVDQLAGPTAAKKGLYDFVLDHHVAHFTIAAAARIGQVYGDFVNQLYTAEIPKDLKEVDAWGNRPRELFCTELETRAEPLEAKAIIAYDLCLKAATNQSWFNEWSTICEVELNQLKPSEYPLAVEAKPEPVYDTPPLRSPSLITALADDVEVATKPDQR